MNEFATNKHQNYNKMHKQNKIVKGKQTKT